jgi:hypothetical protein
LSQQTNAQFGDKYEKYKQAAGAVIKAGLVNVAKNPTAGIIDIQAFLDKMDEKKLYDSYISQYETAKSARRDFSEALEAYATEQNKNLSHNGYNTSVISSRIKCNYNIKHSL